MMDSNPASTGSIMGMSFFAGLSTSWLGLLTSIFVALIVGLLSKGIEVGVRHYFQRRESHWRKEAVKWRKRYLELLSGEKK